LVEEALRSGYRVNRLVNEAVLAWLSGRNVAETLRLKAQLAALMKEEEELRRQCRVMLRSGSFLPKYADRILRPQNSPIRHGQQPLRALNPKEEEIFRRILARREKIAQEIVRIQDRLLPKEKFRLKPSPRRKRRKPKSRSRDKHTPAYATTKKEVHT
jgi:hypothetical protein